MSTLQTPAPGAPAMIDPQHPAPVPALDVHRPAPTTAERLIRSLAGWSIEVAALVWWAEMFIALARVTW